MLGRTSLLCPTGLAWRMIGLAWLLIGVGYATVLIPHIVLQSLSGSLVGWMPTKWHYVSDLGYLLIAIGSWKIERYGLGSRAATILASILFLLQMSETIGIIYTFGAKMIYILPALLLLESVVNILLVLRLRHQHLIRSQIILQKIVIITLIIAVASRVMDFFLFDAPIIGVKRVDLPVYFMLLSLFMQFAAWLTFPLIFLLSAGWMYQIPTRRTHSI